MLANLAVLGMGEKTKEMPAADYLTEEELAFYRRGKNAHSHAAPKSATPQEYAKATGLETLFGALWLAGQQGRLNELFTMMMEAYHGI